MWQPSPRWWWWGWGRQRLALTAAENRHTGVSPPHLAAKPTPPAAREELTQDRSQPVRARLAARRRTRSAALQ